MNSLLLAIAVIALSIIAVLVGRWFSNRSFLKNRKPLSVELIFENDLATSGLDPNIYREVVNKLADVISIEPDLIRPSDKLTVLFSRDSWELSEGQDRFESWLLTRVGNILEFDDVITIADVVRVVQNASHLS